MIDGYCCVRKARYAFIFRTTITYRCVCVPGGGGRGRERRVLQNVLKKK